MLSTLIRRRPLHVSTCKILLGSYCKSSTSFPPGEVAETSVVKENLATSARKKQKKKWKSRVYVTQRSNAAKHVLNIAFPGNDTNIEPGILGIKASQFRRKFLDDIPSLSTSMKIVEKNYKSEDFSKVIDFNGLMAHIGLQEITINDVLTSKTSQGEVSSLLVEKLNSMSDALFIDALILLYRMKCDIKNIHIVESQCLQRIETLTLNNIFLVGDWWLVSGYRSQSYHLKMMAVMRNVVTQLSTPNILQLCYNIGIYQNVPMPFLNDILKLIEDNVDSLSLNGVIIICSAIIKCKGKVDNNDKLMYQIGDRVSRNIQDISAHDLTVVLRSLSRCYFFHHKFLEVAVKHLPEKFSDMTLEMLAHNAFALSRFRVLSQPFMDSVAKRVVEETTTKLRIKSTWMLLRAFTRLNYEPSDADTFFEKCVDLMLQRKQQCQQFPFQFLRALISLAYINRYYDSLLDILYEPEFLEFCIERSPPGVEKHLQFLSTCIKIDKPEYSGHKLFTKDALYHNGTLQEHSFTRDFKIEVNEVSESLQRLTGGPEFVKLHCILNHAGYFSTVADIEMLLDKNGQPMKVGGETNTESEPTTKLAVLLISQSHCLQDSDTPHGSQAMKVRHLQKLGYTVKQVKTKEWSESHSDKEKEDYLINKLSLSLESCDKV
ncbi:FAST kinase domain-containing protein 5, mitochondrial-like [Antedon mediterranea]|uniref:FAST kinase domain-containing protein 5, mitochondrial-like n=1 Tax=Antedon mediterranea TaxID=105859 RepID=UPI003AF93ACF